MEMSSKQKIKRESKIANGSKIRDNVDVLVQIHTEMKNYQ